MSRRVVITGLGVISAVGSDVKSFWESLLAGRPGIGPLQGLPADAVRFPNGAQVRRYESNGQFDPKTLALIDRFAQFSLLAARQANRDAGICWTQQQRSRAVLVMGTSIGGQDAQDSGFQEIYGQNRARIHPYTIPRIMPSSGVSHISMELGLTGPAWCVSTACASSTHAIGQAYWMVRTGMAEVAFAGGAECPFSTGFLKAWDALRVVSPDTCRPFSRGRQGLILGEGAGVLVLEPLESAMARGATIYCEVIGFGMSSDAGHITQPSADGAARAIQAVLDDGRIAPERVGHVNAHGTGTQLNDSIETSALRSVFGSRLGEIPVTSTKSMHGHALGAAGALEAIATSLSIRDRLLPPTANYLGPDPECDVNLVREAPMPAEVDVALSNSFAFGGLNAVLALARIG